MKTIAWRWGVIAPWILMCSALFTRADYSNTVASFNPVAYWRFNETAVSPPLNKTTNASSMGSVLDGAVVTSVIKGQAGAVGTAIRLQNNTTNIAYCAAKVDVPHNWALNNAGAFSVELWVKPFALGSDTTGFCVFSSLMNDFSSSARIGYLMYINNAGRFEFRLGNASSYVGTVNNNALPAFNAALGVWRHVVCVFSGTQTQIYVNGTNVANTTLTAPEIASLQRNSQMPFRLGGTPLNGSLSDYPIISAGGVSGNRGFDGWVDEVAYYQYALTTNQCAAHYAAATTNALGYSAQILADNPTGYWPMNDPVVTPPIPASFPTVANSGSAGAAANGTVLWGGLTAQEGPPYPGMGLGNKAVLLDGANGFVKLGRPAGLDITGNITLMAWVKPTVKNFFRNIIGRGWDGNYEETFIRISRGGENGGYGSTNYYEVGVSDGTNYETARILMPEGDINNWVFLAGTYDGTNWTLYRNGQTVAVTPSSHGARVTTNAWTIGAQSDADIGGPFARPGGISTFFGGYIDEPAIFNTALSATNIYKIYNAALVPTVELQVDDAIAYEPNTNHLAQFSFVRTDTNGSLTVYFGFTQSDLTNGAATFGVDYRTSLTNLVTFSPGEKKKSVLIRPVDDSLIEPPESITLNLLASSNYVIIGPTSGVAVIYDDEQPQLGVCFRDTFDTPASATNWNLFYAQSGGTNVEIPQVVFGYDYIAAGIPPAPGTSTNHGLRLAFTNTALNVPVVANLLHSFNNCSPDWYAMSFDVYMQYNATNNLTQHAMAGINADPTKTNWVFQSPFSINGGGQFVTVAGNDTTNAAIAGVKLWAPAFSSSNAVSTFSPGPIANQLLNNPPYGAKAGNPGVYGCDVNSTNKTWLHCQLLQLGDVVQLKINGYTALEAIVTNAQSGANFPGGSGGTASTNGPVLLSIAQQTTSTRSLDHFVIFDNVEVTPLDGIAITAMGIGGNQVVLFFYSRISSSTLDYAILSSTSLQDLRTSEYPRASYFQWPLIMPVPPGADMSGWFGALLNSAFTKATPSRFFQVRGTNRNAKVTAP